MLLTLRRVVGLLVSLFAINTRAQYGHIIIPSRSSLNEPMDIQTKKIQLQNHQAYLATITGSEPQSYFHVLVKDSECSLEKTSSLSKKFQCEYAINGGPFHSYTKGGCVGLTVSNHTVIQDLETNDDGSVGFGITDSNEWILGNLNSIIHRDGANLNHFNIQEFVTGLNGGWLVYNSTNVVSNRDGQDPAPRTAIGIDREGKRLVLMQVDGCEHCVSRSIRGRGLTLQEMAEAMKGFADYAINLDGGGSSTSVCDEKVINHPTCLDYIMRQCERPVASAICIRDNSMPPGSISTKSSSKEQDLSSQE